MPNWCNNAIEISGNDEQINALEQYLNDNKGKEWFNFFEPIPPEYKEGEKTGNKVLKNKKIFIGTQHSLSMREARVDPILLYIDFVRKQAEDLHEDKEKRKTYLAPVNGWRGLDKKWNWGITPMTSFACYAWDTENKLGRLELREKWYDEIKRLSASEADSSEAIIVDIFSDPDKGYPISITQTEDKEYKIEKDSLKKTETWAEFFGRTRITDNQLLELFKKEPLTDMFHDCYNMRDFNLAVEGLKRFDEKNKYGIFQNEEFIDKLSDIKSHVPAEKTKEETSDKEVSNEVKREVASEEPVKQEPQSAIIPIPKMRRIVGEYITENYGADKKMPDLSVEQLKKWYELVGQGEELPFDEFEQSAPKTEKEKFVEELHKEEPKQEVKKETVSTEGSTTDSSVEDQIAKLRAARAAKK